MWGRLPRIAEMSIPDVKPGTSAAHRAVARLATSKIGIAMVRSLGGRYDPLLLRLTRGRISLVHPFPALLIHHVGARSCKPRTSVVVYFTDRGRIIVIASNFGSRRNPAWYHNVLANREVRLFGRGIDGRFTAEEIVGLERDRLFALAQGAASPYGDYQAAAGDRTIPVIAFAPAVDGHRPA